MEDPENNPSNFLDNLPLSYSVDSDPLVPLSEGKSLQKGSENVESNESKDSFELIRKSQESPRKKKVKVQKFANVNQKFKEVKKNEEEIKDHLERSAKFEYKLEDSSIFTITVFKPPEPATNDWQAPQEQIKTHFEENQRLLIEKDEFAQHDLKSYRPKIPRKAFPWTMFGAGLAAFVVFVIIIIKLRRALRR